MRRKKILIIEDEVDLAGAIKLRIESARNYEVDMAHDGEAGLQAILSDPPDMLILDINIPKLNGIQLYKKISADNTQPKFPVIVFTARAELEDLFEDLNVDGFISKPFKFDDIIGEIDRIFAAKPKPHLFLAGVDKGPGSFIAKTRLRGLGFKVINIGNMEAFKAAAVSCRPDFIVIKLNDAIMPTKEFIADIRDFIGKMKELNKRADLPSVLASKVWPITHNAAIIVYADGNAPRECDAAYLGADIYVDRAEGLDAAVKGVKEAALKKEEEEALRRSAMMTAPGRPKITDLDIFK